MPHRDGTLKTREFIFACEDRAMAALPARFPRPERRMMWTILQLSFDRPDIHFELQPHMGRGLVELGLHCEGPVELNDLVAAHLAALAGDLIPALGEGWELEEWTPSWRRLHRTYAFDQLTVALAQEVGAELARAMQLLQPVLAGAGLPAFVPPAAVHKGKDTGRKWHERRRARR